MARASAIREGGRESADDRDGEGGGNLDTPFVVSFRPSHRIPPRATTPPQSRASGPTETLPRFSMSVTDEPAIEWREGTAPLRVIRRLAGGKAASELCLEEQSLPRRRSTALSSVFTPEGTPPASVPSPLHQITCGILKDSLLGAIKASTVNYSPSSTSCMSNASACSTTGFCYGPPRLQSCYLVLAIIVQAFHLNYSVEITPMVVKCIGINNIVEKVEIKTLQDKKKVPEKCIIAQQITLEDEKQIFSVDGLEKQDVSLILGIPQIRMCVDISHTDIVDLTVSATSIEGKCPGPTLSITNNDNLTVLRIVGKPFGYTKTEAIRVRGNRKLYSGLGEMLRNQFGARIDIQPEGECGVPNPFYSFNQVAGCKSLYGPLVVNGSVADESFRLAPGTKYNYTGCIQISNTNMTDCSFLEAFRKAFFPIEGCNQYITGNKDLCIKDYEIFVEVFGSIEVYDNKADCETECLGGDVNAAYLRRNAKCTVVHGDLVIRDWVFSKPAGVAMLRKVEEIGGRLIIKNTTGIQVLDDFSSLKYIGRNTSEEVKIIIKDNPHLKTLSIPNLQRIRLSKSNPRLLLVNNPHLQMPDFDPDETEETTTEMPPEPSLPPSQKNYTLPGGITRHTPRHRVRPTKHAPRSKKGKEPDEGFWKRLLHYWYIIAIAILLLIILLIVLLVVVIFLVKMKRKGLSMVISPYKLDSSSSTTLKSLVRDVLSLDPFVWCARERELLWNADPQPPAVSTERMQAGADEPLEEKDEDFLKRKMIPVASNAKIVPKRETDYDKPLLHRSQQIFPFDSAIIVSDVGPISDSLPRLPCKVGKMQLYMDGKLNTSITYKLMRIKHHYDNLTVYSYEARNVRLHIKRSLRAIFYVRAPTERMWKDCDVPLQIFACCHKKNTILVSNRYKELFSMLHLIFITTVQLKKPVPLRDLFRIHSQNCNGAPLDRFEMLFTLRFILAWAQSASCVPPDTVEDPDQWGEIYDEIAKFAALHPNIVNIHPRHVYGVIPELEERMKNAENTPGRQFAERPPTPMCDAFRPMTPEEIKMKNNKLLSSAENIDASSKEAPIKGAKDTFWDAKPSDTNKQERSKQESAAGAPAKFRPTAEPGKGYLPRRRESRDSPAKSPASPTTTAMANAAKKIFGAGKHKRGGGSEQLPPAGRKRSLGSLLARVAPVGPKKSATCTAIGTTTQQETAATQF